MTDSYDAYGEEVPTEVTDLYGDVEADEYATKDELAQAELAKLRAQVAAIDARMQPPSVHGGQPYTGPTPADHEVSPDSLWGLSEIEPSRKFTAEDAGGMDDFAAPLTVEQKWQRAWAKAFPTPPRSQGGA